MTHFLLFYVWIPFTVWLAKRIFLCFFFRTSPLPGTDSNVLHVYFSHVKYNFNVNFTFWQFYTRYEKLWHIFFYDNTLYNSNLLLSVWSYRSIRIRGLTHCIWQIYEYIDNLITPINRGGGRGAIMVFKSKEISCISVH